MANRLFQIIFITIVFYSYCDAQSGRANFLSLNSANTSINWQIKTVEETDNIQDFFENDYDKSNWLKSTVPGTIFTDYVNLGLEKDPNFGDNIYNVDRNKYNKTFWYRTEFDVPSELANHKHIVLNFDGINRVGVVYLNGKELGELRGFMIRGRFNVTNILNKKGKNTLLVKVFVPNQKRHPEEKFANLASPTYLSSAGWDWMPYVPGLNSGITDNVYLTATQDVAINDTWIRTALNSNFSVADVEITTELVNNTSKTKNIKLSYVILPGDISFSEEYTILAGKKQNIVLNPRNVSSLRIENPLLWWPNGYGLPNLYTCKVIVDVDGKISDQSELKFGIKEYSYATVNNAFQVQINGQKIFLKGGNWGMSEYLLRCRGEEYDTKIRLHKEMNFNVIRNWMGSVTDKEFYDACDKYGILIWDDFWLNSKFDVPEFPDDFNKNAIEKIKRFRNHPSIALWCGENEGTPGKYKDGEDLNQNLQKFVEMHDAGDRHYQPDSRKGNGLSGSGLWKNYKPSFYFANASNSIYGDKYPEGKGWGLRSEIGTAVFTTFESFKEFIPKEYWWPRNEMWNKHFFGSLAKNGGPDVYMESVKNSYGESKGIEEFCEKAQMLNIETNKAIYEAWGNHLWNDASGVLMWMSQSAYPSFVWQTYDYYYDLTGAYWGAKSGCEPTHILWNSNDNWIKVVNATLENKTKMYASAKMYNIHGNEIKSLAKLDTIDLKPNSVTSCFKLMTDDNLAWSKKATTSSVKSNNTADKLTDSNLYSQWESNSNSDEWVYVDLQEEKEISNVRLVWGDNYAVAYSVSISTDLIKWTQVYTEKEGNGKTDNITFSTCKARYVKLTCNKSINTTGYKIAEFEVKKEQPKEMTDVNFIRLTLKDTNGKIISSNEYWMGDNEGDYKQINTLAQADLAFYITRREVKDGKHYIDLRITNKSATPAFGVRARLIDMKTNKRVLPAIMNSNYLLLLPKEVKNINFEFDDANYSNADIRVLVKQYGFSETMVE